MTDVAKAAAAAVAAAPADDDVAEEADGTDAAFKFRFEAVGVKLLLNVLLDNVVVELFKDLLDFINLQ